MLLRELDELLSVAAAARTEQDPLRDREQESAKREEDRVEESADHGFILTVTTRVQPVDEGRNQTTAVPDMNEQRHVSKLVGAACVQLIGFDQYLPL